MHLKAELLEVHIFLVVTSPLPCGKVIFCCLSGSIALIHNRIAFAEGFYIGILYNADAAT